MNAAGPVSLVLDLRVAHDRVDSSADPALNGHLHYPYASTSGRLHSEFIRILFLQVHRETDRFFLQLQEFCQWNQIVDSSTTTVWLFLL
jgi:hypothetical protein